MKQRLGSLVSGVKFKFVSDVDGFATKEDTIEKIKASRSWENYHLINQNTGAEVYCNSNLEGRTVKVDVESFKAACRASFSDRDKQLLWVIEEVVERLGVEHCVYFRKNYKVYFKYKGKTGFELRGNEFVFDAGKLTVSDHEKTDNDMFFLDSVIGLLTWACKRKLNEL